ncbi:MAG: hypothetical protein ACYTG3_12740 [Planctomycetota bacterium]|jgi:hypothetical protein
MTTEQNLERLERGGGAARVGILFALLLSACASSEYVRVGSSTYPPRPEEFPIAVFVGASASVSTQEELRDTARDAASLPAHETIGRVDVMGGMWVSWAKVVKEGKSRARELGGDAIVVGETSEDANAMPRVALEIVRYRDQSRAQAVLDQLAEGKPKD